MFVINSEDRSIYATRGDVVFFKVSATYDGEPYVFTTEDVLRVRIFEKKACQRLMLLKDFNVEAEAHTVELYLSGEETKFGGVINKPTDFWYEVELNPDTKPQTIIGYNEDGPAIFRLYPEGIDFTDGDADYADEILKGELISTIEKIVQETIKEQLLETKVEEVLKEIIKTDPAIKGADGKDGADGLTPYIGDNGNWWIGVEDTGESAHGAGYAPLLRIDETSYEWEVSYDNGVTWQALGVKAKGEAGSFGDYTDEEKQELVEEVITYLTQEGDTELTENFYDTIINHINENPDAVEVGANNYVVTIIEDGDGYLADKTFAEVTAAIESGDVVVCDYTRGTNHSVGQLVIYTEQYISFVMPNPFGGDLYMNLNSDDTVTDFKETVNEDRMPSAVSTVASGSTVTVTATYEDASTSVSVITLDDNNYPVGITKDGVDCALTWGGFE